MKVSKNLVIGSLVLILFVSIITAISFHQERTESFHQERTEEEKCERALGSLKDFRSERSVHREEAIALGILTREEVNKEEEIEESKMSNYYHGCKDLIGK